MVCFGTYASGGSSDTKVYLMLSNGDGTFQAPVLIDDELGGGATPFAIPTRICPWYND
ncbi:MAG: hypothetical protein ABIK09_10660 [Pseudomonadota bacterium]